MLVNPKGGSNAMEANGKVAQKREDAIQRASKEGNWEEVLRQLYLIEENLNRKDRAYGLCSLNRVNVGGSGELLDTISDNRDPLKILVHEEEKNHLKQALYTLTEIERDIFLGQVEYCWSFSKLARMYSISDKTAKKYYENACAKMKKKLIEENII